MFKGMTAKLLEVVGDSSITTIFIFSYVLIYKVSFFSLSDLEWENVIFRISAASFLELVYYVRWN